MLISSKGTGICPFLVTTPQLLCMRSCTKQDSGFVHIYISNTPCHSKPCFHRMQMGDRMTVLNQACTECRWPQEWAPACVAYNT